MGVQFTREAAGKIKRAVRQIEGEPRTSPVTIPRESNQTRSGLWALTPSGGIPAIDGTTLGSALCDLYYEYPTTFSGTDRELLPLASPGGTVATQDYVYNCSDTAVGGSVYVPIEMSATGAWRAVPDASGATLTRATAQGTYIWSESSVSINDEFDDNYPTGPSSSNHDVIESQSVPTAHLKLMTTGYYQVYMKGYGAFVGTPGSTMTLRFLTKLWDGASTYNGLAGDSPTYTDVVMPDTVTQPTYYWESGHYYMANVTSGVLASTSYLTGRVIVKQGNSDFNATLELRINYYGPN